VSGPPSSTASGESRLFTPAFVALAIADLAYFTAAGILIQVTPLFAKGPLGADPVGVGIAIGAFSVTALVLRPWAGRESDRRGRRPLLVAGALLAGVAVAGHILTDNLLVLVILRLVLGAAEALFFVAGFALLADLAPPNRAGEALSFNSLALYLGIALGPILGEFLLGVGGYELAWAGGSALSLLAAALALRLPSTGRTPAAELEPTSLIHRGVLGPSLGLFAGVSAMAGFLTFVAIYGRDDLGMSGSGPVLLVFGMIVVGCRIFFAKLPDRVPPYRLAAGALVAVTVGMAVAGLVRSVPGLIVGAAILAIGIAFLTPAFFAAMMARVRPSERGAAFGTVSIFLDLAFGGGPVLLGFLVDAAGIPAAFVAGAIIPAFGAAATLVASLPRRAAAASP
jgi:MFS family permease